MASSRLLDELSEFTELCSARGSMTHCTGTIDVESRREARGLFVPAAMSQEKDKFASARSSTTDSELISNKRTAR